MGAGIERQRCTRERRAACARLHSRGHHGPPAQRELAPGEQRVASGSTAHASEAPPSSSRSASGRGLGWALGSSGSAAHVRGGLQVHACTRGDIMGRQLSASWRRASNVSRVAAPLTRLKPRRRAADRPMEEGSVGRWDRAVSLCDFFYYYFLSGQASPAGRHNADSLINTEPACNYQFSTSETFYTVMR